MANIEHLKIIEQGVATWNKWRVENKTITPDLSHAQLQEVNLAKANFQSCNLSRANLSKAILVGANFEQAKLDNANLSESFLVGANFYQANLVSANLTDIDINKTVIFKEGENEEDYTVFNGLDLHQAFLIYANLSNSNLKGANLSGANLKMAQLYQTNLTEVNLSQVELSHADLTQATLIRTNIEGASITDTQLYGIATWDLIGIPKVQKDLIITPSDQAKITVDNIEVAQFIYLMLNNQKIRDVIGTIAKKGVLILGRFSEERKPILDAIREELRKLDFVPMMFDFEKIKSRDYTETVKVLAGMSRFVIVDITHQSSCPLELQATVPDYKIPFLPIILKGERPFAMLIDLIRKYDWVSQVLEYKSKEELIDRLQVEIIEEAIGIEQTLQRKARSSYIRANR